MLRQKISLIVFTLIALVAASSAQARFLQTDPIGYGDGLNWYAYVGNDPLNNTDPSGALKCDGDDRCEEVHQAAEDARTSIKEANNKLASLSDAIKNGDELTQEQQDTKSAFENKFGKGSATRKNLKKASKALNKISKKIGERGKGAEIKFSSDAGLVASAPIGGSHITIGGRFSKTTLDKVGVITHEGGHLAGFRDVQIPSSLTVGRLWPDGTRHAYGRSAAAWLGSNQPKNALRNSDNYSCLVNPVACGGP